VASVVSVSRGEELARYAINPPMRGLIEGLPTPRPIGAELPAAFQEDDFCQRFVRALDDVLAPVFTTLDCWDSYLDPGLAPDDFVDWLASWVGVDIDETWTLERRRRLIQDAVGLYRIRGTAAGLAAHVRLYAGVTPEIVESGGCTWSESAGTPLPGSAQPQLTVRLRVDDQATINQATVSRIVAASRPAHLPYDVEVVTVGAAVTPVLPDTGAAPSASPDGEGTREVPAQDTEGARDEAPGAVDLPGSERIELAPHAPESPAEPEELPEPPSPDGKETTE
jgi:phage tail-like protein